MFTPSDVTVVVVNYRTEDYTRRCYESFRAAYPATPMILIDNGSADASAELIEQIGKRDPAARAILLSSNIFHGPAMDCGIKAATTRFVFVLDSDTETLAGGFLEQMLAMFAADDRVYAVGKQGWTNRFGYVPVSRREPHTAYIHPFASMIDRDKYLTLSPFVHHGAPSYRNMWAARRANYRLPHFPIEDYIRHFGKVTANKFGYGYTRAMRFQLLLNRADQKLRRLGARLRGKPLQPPEKPA